MKIAIIGAGISGVSAGRMLKDGGHEVVLYEKNDRPGGLVRCDWVEDNLYHRVGGHVFNTKIPEVAAWFWQHFDREKEFLQAKRNARILLGDRSIGYPIENHLRQLGADTCRDVLRDLLAIEQRGARDPFSWPHFGAFLRGNFGDTLYELYFGPYNRKIWQMDLSAVAMDWLDGKLPMPTPQGILLANILAREEREMVHSTFWYPRRGGSQFIIDRLADGLAVKTNCPAERLEHRSDRWYVNGEGPCDRIVYTADIRLLHKILKSTNQQINESTHAVKGLRSNGTSNIFCTTDPTDLSWLYLPGPETRAHRIIYTGNFSPDNNAPGGRSTCVVEFSGYVDAHEMQREIRQLPGNLEPLAHHHEANSYVIQDAGTRAKVRELRSVLQNTGFDISGRFAEWEYYNMDTAIGAVISIQ